MSALPPLMKAMNQENVVALVRRVYQKNSTPKLGLLIPEENSKFGQVNNSLRNTIFPDIRPTCITLRAFHSKVTVHKCAGIIRTLVLIEGVRGSYLRKYGIVLSC